MAERARHDRRHFLGAAAGTLTAASLGMLTGVARASEVQSSAAPAANKRPLPPFGPVKQIEAGLLNVGYVDLGPSDGYPVILLHGWPYDIHSYERAAPLLASSGYRAIVPYLRGYGTTRFLSADTVRNGQQSVVALDVIALLDALKIQK